MQIASFSLPLHYLIHRNNLCNEWHFDHLCYLLFAATEFYISLLVIHRVYLCLKVDSAGVGCRCRLSVSVVGVFRSQMTAIDLKSIELHVAICIGNGIEDL